MKAFLFKVSPGALVGYGCVITPLIAHSRTIAALAGVLGVVVKLYSPGLFSENPFDYVFKQHSYVVRDRSKPVPVDKVLGGSETLQ